MAELELNSHFIVGERLSICTLIARRDRLCRLSKPADGKVSPRRSPLNPTRYIDSLRRTHEEQGRVL